MKGRNLLTFLLLFMPAANIICFGEIFCELLPTGRRPGGSPCRVAHYLHQLGQPVQLISQVGDDEMGHELLAQLIAYGLDITLVQLSVTHLTGLVKPPGRDEDRFKWHKIVQPLAWDYIQYAEALSTEVAQSKMLFYSSLVARNQVSRETLYRLLQHAQFKVFDVTSHPAHHNQEVIKYLLQQANFVKLNEPDLAELMDWQGGPTDVETALPWLTRRFDLQAICLTRGTAGASLYARNSWWHSPGLEPATVGNARECDDAFLAGLLTGWAAGHAPAECMRQARAIRAVVAQQSDASSCIIAENDLHSLR